MGTPTTAPLIPELSQRPTAVFLQGSNRPLLNWVLYALAVRSNSSFFWTDVRPIDEALDPLDPLARHVVPEGQIGIRPPEDLRPNPESSSTISSMIRSDEPRDSIRQLADFLRLPSRTQELIVRTSTDGRTPLFAISNTQRLRNVFPPDALRPVLAAILDSGASLAMTWAEPMPPRSLAFEFVLELEGTSPTDWKDANLHCTLGNSSGVVRPGRTFRLGDLAPIAEVLEPFRLNRR